MLFYRQKFLLDFLDALGGEIRHLDFQKLLFLFCMETDEPRYEFVPFRFGGFSFTSHADKRKLIEKGFLDRREDWWVLTGREASGAELPAEERARIERFVKQQGHLRGDALVAETYRRYPYYATRSAISDQLLAEDAAGLAAIEAARPSLGEPGVCTIGYEGKSLEGYLNCLLRNGVNVLCDVRRNPLSRKYGFSKRTLAKSCEGIGIRYEHLAQLGISSENRRQLHTQNDYDDLFAEYERKSLPEQVAALKQIHRWVEAGERVALTCYEHLPEQCHRHCVAEALEREFGSRFLPRHL